MGGAQPASLPVQVQTTIANTVTYTFSLPDDYLVALWIDGIAVEYDPGIKAIVSIPGFADHSGTAIDVLNGLEQPLTTSGEEGDLGIRDLLVKDYPGILQLSSRKRIFLPLVLRKDPGWRIAQSGSRRGK